VPQQSQLLMQLADAAALNGAAGMAELADAPG
jgi:hypothetical protein